MYSKVSCIILRIVLTVFIHMATEVDTDEHGIVTHSLRSILESWPASKPKPKVFYTVPVRLIVIEWHIPTFTHMFHATSMEATHRESQPLWSAD